MEKPPPVRARLRALPEWMGPALCPVLARTPRRRTEPRLLLFEYQNSKLTSMFFSGKLGVA